MRKIFIILLLVVTVWSNEFDNAVEDYQKGNYIKALNSFYILAKHDDIQAQYNVGLIYANGKGVEKDIFKAMKWYEKSAQQGNASAAYNLAQIYHNMQKDNNHAHKRAKYWYEKAIDKAGLTRAYNNLAALYLDGKNIAHDKQKAFELFKKAALKGDANAQINLGLMYAWGKNMQNDKMKAFENFKKALKAGKSEASHYLDRLCKESAWVCKN